MQLSIILLGLTLFAYCSNNSNQNSSNPSFPNVDSIVTEICHDMKRDSSILDTTLLRKHFYTHTNQLLQNLSNSGRDSLIKIVYYKLQINCQPYWDFINRFLPKNKNWIEHKTKPISKVGNDSCKQFRAHNSFRYFEYDGPVVNINIENGIWTEQYHDKTYSKLKITWLNECQFQLTFIETNNLSRKSVSKPSSTYTYNLIEQGNGYYTVVLEMPESVFLEFKLYH